MSEHTLREKLAEKADECRCGHRFADHSAVRNAYCMMGGCPCTQFTKVKNKLEATLLWAKRALELGYGAGSVPWIDEALAATPAPVMPWCPHCEAPTEESCVCPRGPAPSGATRRFTVEGFCGGEYAGVYDREHRMDLSEYTEKNGLS